MDVLVSIIMPVYNASKYLERSIEAVIKQSYPRFELIIVDDGSSDNSLEIINNYSKLDSRVRCFAQRNQGPSAARNNALQYVSGDYLMCVDADDILHENAIKRVIDRILSTNSDVCIYSWNRIENDRRVPYVYSEDELNTNLSNLISKLFIKPYYCGGGNPWNKVWRVKSIKKQGHISLFREDIQIYEDFLWCLENFDCVQSIAFLNEQLYDYYIHDLSISRAGNKVELRRNYYYGAREVYKYILKHHPDNYIDIEAWYRNELTSLLLEKWRNGDQLLEKGELFEFPKVFLKHDRIKLWIKYLFVRFVATIEKSR